MPWPLALALLSDPDRVDTLDLAAWDRCLPWWRRRGVLGQVQARLDAAGALQRVPAPVRGHLQAARILADAQQRQLGWETGRVARALAGEPGPVVLLKGAAYLARGMPWARGRLAADLDLLVPEQRLEAVEQRLLAHGWQDTVGDAYDQRYYRRWMHELPPLRHRLRGSMLDLHHNLLPRTDRLSPDAGLLLAAICPAGERGLYTLAPADMLLHAAVHGWRAGELSNPLRELLDIDGLARFDAATQPDYWPTLVQRAAELGLTRPLYHALAAAKRHLCTPVPEATLAELRPAGPGSAMLAALTLGALRAQAPGEGTACALLALRAHLLRMPPRLLVPHLARKVARRWSAARGQS